MATLAQQRRQQKLRSSILNHESTTPLALALALKAAVLKEAVGNR